MQPPANNNPLAAPLFVPQVLVTREGYKLPMTRKMQEPIYYCSKVFQPGQYKLCTDGIPDTVVSEFTATSKATYGSWPYPLVITVHMQAVDTWCEDDAVPV